jgi:putative flippase GtrA
MTGGQPRDLNGAGRRSELRDLALKLVRFGLTGGLATLLYGLFAMAIYAVAGWSTLAVHTLAFALAIPVSFFGQMLFTFRYRGARLRALLRFLATAAIAFSLSTVAVYVVEQRGWHYAVGIVVTMLIVPLISFLMMLLWVFTDSAGEEAAEIERS